MAISTTARYPGGQLRTVMMLFIVAGAVVVYFSAGGSLVAQRIRSVLSGMSPPLTLEHNCSRSVAAPATHSDDLSALRSCPGAGQALADASEAIPRLFVFVRAGTAFLRRFILGIDHPVRELIVIQDGADDREIWVLIVNMTRASAQPLVGHISLIVNPEHTGCAEAWNTAFRMYPCEQAWMLMSNDIVFWPGHMKLFADAVSMSANSATDDAGALSVQVDHVGNGDTRSDNIRRTFGVTGMAILRRGALRAGLMDENYYPGYYEDDDLVMRMWHSGLRFYSVPGVVVRHGSSSRYETGTVVEDASGQFSREVSRSANRAYFMAKWGPNTTSIDYNFLEWKRDDMLSKCRSGGSDVWVPGRYCTPFNASVTAASWVFIKELRDCIRDTGPLPKDGCAAHVALAQGAVMRRAGKA